MSVPIRIQHCYPTITKNSQYEFTDLNTVGASSALFGGPTLINHSHYEAVGLRKIQGFGLRDVEARVKVWCFVGKTVAAEKASRFPRSSSYLNQGFLAYILHG